MRASEIIFAIEESSEGGFEAHALDFPIHTQGQTIGELKEMLRDAAVGCHFAEADKPAVIRMHFVRDGIISA